MFGGTLEDTVTGSRIEILHINAQQRRVPLDQILFVLRIVDEAFVVRFPERINVVIVNQSQSHSSGRSAKCQGPPQNVFQKGV
jgi:hypothetical protein